MSDITTYKVPAEWVAHLSALWRQVQADRQQQMMLRGQILLLQEQVANNTREIQNIVATLAREAGLPEGSYVLSDDATTITTAPKPQ